MRISPMPRVCFGLLCGLLTLLAGCGNPAIQSLDSLTITATPSSIPVGGSAVLKAVAHLSDGTTQDVTSGTQWTLSNSALATVSNGTLTAKAAGSLTLQAAYVEVTPAGNSPASATVSPQTLAATAQLSITPASPPASLIAPSITWNTPAAITYGTALSSTQLDATANVAGTFVYSPAAGTVLQAGTQQLSATFTPTDTATYSTATASVQLTVNAASTPVSPAPPSPGAPPTGCGGPTINLNSGMSQSTLQSSIANAPGCSLIMFAAGTYNITNTLTLKCGVTYSGPAVGLVNGLATPTAILSGSSMAIGTHIFALWSSLNGNPCSQPTTIEYLNFSGNSGITVETPFTNLLIEYNVFSNIPGSKGQTDAADFDSVSGSNNSNAMLTNTTITHNLLGDTNSCLSPTNVMADTDSPEDYEGACNGLVFQTSINGLTMTNNNLVHVAEGVHINCPAYANQQYVCEPPGGAITQNITLEYNDFSNIHRIAWEQQNQQSSGIVIMYNSEHDWVNPYFGSMGLSMACCYNGTLAEPNLMVENNVVIFNTPTNQQDFIGFGYEAAGHLAHYDNNLMQMNTFDSGKTNAPAIAWGCGPNASDSYNTLQGRWGGYVVSEEIGACGSDTTPASLVGNVTSPTLSALTSTAPSIAPNGGSSTFPLTVTLTDAGYTSGSQPLGNTGIWYTTDGSTPVPGTGTAQYLASGGTFVLNGPATVKAVGMWGAVNQPASYPSGYGFVPSSVVSAAFTGSGSVQKPAGKANTSISPTATPSVGASAGLPAATASARVESVAITPAQPVVGIGSTIQLKAIATFDDGSVKDVTADFAWQSSDERIMTATGAGTLTGVASGKAKVSGNYGGLQSAVSVNSTIGEIAWSDPIVITAGGVYSGNWQSTDPKTAAVTVATTEPVTIENSHIRGTSDLIATKVPGSNLTVRNSLGIGLNATVKGQANGSFVEVSSPARLDVENNYVENTRGGVIVHGYGGDRNGQQTILIRGNRARNLNGLVSDGTGGHLAGNGQSQSAAHFIQFDSVQAVPSIEVGWNEVINYPGLSLVNDNIDLYRSSGTANQPLEIHDTYIQGAYPSKAQDAYAGGGIQTEGASTDSAAEAPAFINIHDNQVIATVNHGIRFAAGHDNIATNNRLISSGLMADGTRIAAQDVGLANGTVGSAAASGSMYNNTMRDNLIGWTCWQSSCAEQGYRKDQFFPASPADYSSNSVVKTRRITLDMENNEYQVWLNKMTVAGVAVGPSF